MEDSPKERVNIGKIIFSIFIPIFLFLLFVMLLGERWLEIHREEIALGWIIFLFIIFIFELAIYSKKSLLILTKVFKKTLKIAIVLIIISFILLIFGYFYNSQSIDASKLSIISITPNDIFVDDWDQGFCSINIKNDGLDIAKNIEIEGHISLKNEDIVLADFNSRVSMVPRGYIKPGEIYTCKFYLWDLNEENNFSNSFSVRKKYFLYEYINEIRKINIENGNWSKSDYRTNHDI